MRKYDDYKNDDDLERDLTEEELKNIKWSKFKIIVPTEEDKNELIEALEHIHYSDIDTGFITVNQLAHEYLNGTNIIVNNELYNSL